MLLNPLVGIWLIEISETLEAIAKAFLELHSLSPQDELNGDCLMRRLRLEVIRLKTRSENILLMV